MARKTIYILNGPNLNLLGSRETSLYGTMDLASLDALCIEQGKALELSVDCRQSNHEGDLIDWIQEGSHQAQGLIINAGGFTHSSIAIMDALRAFEKPAIEVHLSNIFQREPYRHTSYISKAVKGIISGLGPMGYQVALIALADTLNEKVVKKNKGKGSK